MPYSNVPEALWDKMDRCVEEVQAKGQDKAAAIAICHASLVDGNSAQLDFILHPETFGLDDSAMTTIADYVSTAPGDPFRLLPFGVLVKGGVRRDITPAIAKTFRLPHFKPPIKLGSHDETTPAGAHIVGLEVRDDGLYAIPEVNEAGMKALAAGAYRYHSPEIIWGDGFEDPTTGKIMAGPLIVGDAMLHTPHLGEAAALYTYEPKNKNSIGGVMETVQVEKTLWDKLSSWLFKRIDEAEAAKAPETPPAPPAPPEVPQEYKAAVVERDELKAKITALETANATKARIESFAAQLQAVAVAEGAEIMAGMTDEQAAWVIKNYKAFAEQVKLSGEIGSSGDAPATIDLNTVLTAYAREHGLSYPAAVAKLASEKPELFRAKEG